MDSEGEHLARETLPLMLDENGKGPNLESTKKRKHPFISNRIFENIEQRRWYAAFEEA